MSGLNTDSPLFVNNTIYAKNVSKTVWHVYGKASFINNIICSEAAGDVFIEQFSASDPDIFDNNLMWAASLIGDRIYMNETVVNINDGTGGTANDGLLTPELNGVALTSSADNVTLLTTQDQYSVFTDPDNNDFSLKASSPAKAKGRTGTNIPTIDINGNPRGNPPSCGAYE